MKTGIDKAVSEICKAYGHAPKAGIHELYYILIELLETKEQAFSEPRIPDSELPTVEDVQAIYDQYKK